MSSCFSRWKPVALLIIPFVFVLLLSIQAQAATLTNAGFWETSIQNFVDVLVGPIALAMILVSIIGGIGFVQCREFNGFTRSMVAMNLCGSILLAAKPFINSLFAG